MLTLLASLALAKTTTSLAVPVEPPAGTGKHRDGGQPR